MDFKDIAAQTVTYILPYVFKSISVAGRKALEKIGEKSGEGIAQNAHNIWKKIRERFGKDKKIKSAASVLKADPSDADAKHMLQNALAECLKTDSKFASELLDMLGSYPQDQIVKVTKSKNVQVSQESNGYGVQSSIVNNSNGVIVSQKKK